MTTPKTPPRLRPPRRYGKRPFALAAVVVMASLGPINAASAQEFDESQIEAIIDQVAAEVGNEDLNLDTALPDLEDCLSRTLVFATPGERDVVGTNQDDCIFGNGQNNLIRAGSGDDIIYGLGGFDAIFGERGDDVVVGMDGSDLLDGGTGDDLLVGGQGRDRMNGGLGDGIDILYGQAGSDTIVNGAGGGAAFGAGGNDKMTSIGGTINIIRGGAGKDVITGSNNTATLDLLLGGPADDIINGRGGNDILEGQGGADQLDGGAGTDTLDGGAGNDSCLNGEQNLNCELIQNS